MIEMGPKARNEVVVSLKLGPCAAPSLSLSPLHPTVSTCSLSQFLNSHRVWNSHGVPMSQQGTGRPLIPGEDFSGNLIVSQTKVLASLGPHYL